MHIRYEHQINKFLPCLDASTCNLCVSLLTNEQNLTQRTIFRISARAKLGKSVKLEIFQVMSKCFDTCTTMTK